MPRSKSKPPPLPRIVKQKQRRIPAQLMLDLNDVARGHLANGSIRLNLDLWLVLQAVLLNHIDGKYSTAHQLAGRLGIPRVTVRDRLILLVRLRQLANHKSRFWISEARARSRVAHSKSLALIQDAARGIKRLKR